MKLSTKAVFAATAALYASTTEASLAAFCPNDGEMCFQWGVPGGVSTSGETQLYFQLRAPVSNAWMALGTGSSMTGSNMFVVYQNGNNVTLSTRQGKGQVMPQYSPLPGVELLQGSGIVNGNLVANIRCSDCSFIDISNSSNWIAASRIGAAIDSSSVSAPISIHDSYTKFSVNLNQASIASDSNPFLTAATNGGTKPTNTGITTSSDNTRALLSAHGAIMAIAFLVGYPLGSALMPLLGKWLLHAGWQILAFIGMWIGFALGYVISSRANRFFADAHMRLGVIVCVLMILQPVLGWLHHMHFVKFGKRGAVSHVHLWYGRLLMLLGIVNGGVGLQFSAAPSQFVAAYSVVAAVVSIVYLVGMSFGIAKRRKPGNRVGSSSMTELSNYNARNVM